MERREEEGRGKRIERRKRRIIYTNTSSAEPRK